jgi:thioredoxin-related protein
MKNDNVVFVYITNQTSPLASYNNMVGGIKGEHYRVSTDEWKYLCAKFNIVGIPHCILVDTEGKVADPHLPHLENNGIKTRITALQKAR